MRRTLLLAPLLFGNALFAQVVITESGPFVVPAGVTQVTFELIGAGGNGAFNGGGGGGGGAYVRGTYSVTPGTSYSIVIGQGGSELGTIVGGMGLIAGAGENATTAPNPNIGGGGAGGTPLGGQTSRNGGAGGGGYYTYFGGGGGGAGGSLAAGGAGGNTIAYTGGNCLTPGGAAGIGGGAPAGNGGKGAGFLDNSCTVSNPADNGVSYGGGGGGGNGISSPPGTGGGGVCIITWNIGTGVDEANSAALQLANTLFSDRIVLRNTTGSEHYELLDAMGRMVWNGMRIQDQDLSQLRAGAYALRVTAGDRVRSLRLIKE